MPPSALQGELRKKKPFELPEQEAMLNTLRTAWVLQGDFDRLFREHALSMAQYNVLRILRGAARQAHTDGLPCSEVGARMITRDPDMTRLLAGLEKRKFISRTRDPEDRRVIKVRITPQGAGVLAGLDKPIRDLHQRQMKVLSGVQLRQLVALLEKLRQSGNPAG